MSNKKYYQWKRYWVPSDTIINIDYSGFPYLSFSDNTPPKTLEEISSIPCVILLGEPGMGKTTSIKQVIHDKDAYSLVYQLNKCSNEKYLFEGIEKSQEYKYAKRNKKKLFLYLDALDEAFLNLNTISNYFPDWIRNAQLVFQNIKPNDSLFNIRIICRSESWPKQLTESLHEIFGNSNVNEYKIAPLSKSDIAIACKEENIDSLEFIEVIRESEAIGFAIQPITLSFLLEEYKQNKISKSKIDKTKLYLDGLQRLCEDKNLGHKSKLTLTPIQRIFLASRIAAYSVFSNRNIISREIGDSEEMRISINEIVGDSFQYSENSKEEITLKKLNETFNSGLFSTYNNNNNNITWSHRSFQEFLAAWHITRLKLHSTQILQLIKSDDESNKIVPQLLETAKWLIRMNSSVYEELVNTDPEFLLRYCDIDSDKRPRLVDSLLNFASNYEHVDEFNDQDFYYKLKHENLNIQLQKYISGKKYNIIVRRIAIRIAGKCEIKEIQSDLYKVIIDKSNPSHLKKEALEILGQVGINEFKKNLVQLLNEGIEVDEEDELRGELLEILYPQYIDTYTMINSLTPRKRGNIWGAYKAFLVSVGPKIPDSDIVIALEEIAKKELFLLEYRSNEFTELIDSIIEKAWSNFLLPNIPKALASLIIQFYNHHIDFFIPNDNKKRRIIASELIDNLKDDDIVFYLSFSRSSNNQTLLDINDKEWLISLLPNLDSGKRKLVGQLLWYFTDIRNISDANQFLEIGNLYNEIREKFKDWFDPIDLNSEKASKLKRINKEDSRYRGNDRPRKKKKKSNWPTEETLKLLDEFVNGRLEAWWKMIFVMRLNSNLEYFTNHDYEFDIKKLPVWEQLDSQSQSKIYLSAIRYLNEYKNIETSWIFSNKYNRRELAGYKAIILLASVKEETYFNEISNEIIKNWIPIILHCYFISSNDISKEESFIIKHIYELDKSQCLIWIKKYLDTKIGANKETHSFHLDDLDCFYCNELFQLCLTYLNDTGTPPKTQTEILYFINKHEPLLSIDVALGHFKKLRNEFINESERSLAITCTVFLINNPSQNFWPDIWDLIENNVAIGRELLENSSYGFGYRSAEKLKNLNQLDRAKIFLWLNNQYPPHEDPKHDGVYSPSQRDYIVELRDQIRRDLIEEGTREAVKALDWVKTNMIDQDSASWWIYYAREKMREKSWNPPKPSELKILLQNSEKRLVRNGKELLIVIEESLKRLQNKLKGNNPTSNFLWNQKTIERKVIFSPKDENSLSDFVKMHFDYDLIERKLIINREVEIKRSTGHKDGERIDLLIQTHSEHGIPITIVVETKGCWNPEVNSAIVGQLKNRYLSDYKTKFGIYLIGWFYCTHYKPSKASSLSELEREMETKIKNNTDEESTIKYFILDCTL